MLQIRPSAVGARLRELRQHSGMTLEQLSVETGISTSTLSRLESGHRKPTLELLLPLADAYNVSLDEIARVPVDEDPRVEQKPFTQRGITFVPLTRNGRGLQAYKLILPGQSKAGKIKQTVHDGYEWVYVLTGHLRLLLGKSELVLGPGEVAEFDTRVPHAMASAGPGRVEIISLFGRQGERMHVRARTS